MQYQVIVPKKVQKEISKVDKRFYSKIITALAVLSSDPYLGKKLEGDHEGEWSFRVWPYRIIYRIKNKELVVLVIKIGHRQGVH